MPNGYSISRRKYRRRANRRSDEDNKRQQQQQQQRHREDTVFIVNKLFPWEILLPSSSTNFQNVHIFKLRGIQETHTNHGPQKYALL